MGQLGQLGKKDQDRQGVDESRHHGAGYEAHQRAQAQIAGGDLQHPGQQGGGQQVLQAVFLDQGHHQQRHGARGRRDHPRPTADEGDHHGDAEGGVEPHLGIEPGDDGKGDGFRDERQGDHQAGQHVVLHIGEPMRLEGMQHR